MIGHDLGTATNERNLNGSNDYPHQAMTILRETTALMKPSESIQASFIRAFLKCNLDALKDRIDIRCSTRGAMPLFGNGAVEPRGVLKDTRKTMAFRRHHTRMYRHSQHPLAEPRETLQAGTKGLAQRGAVEYVR